MIPINGNKFVVTGGAGFIGSHICEELVKQGKQVVVIDDLSNSCLDNFEGWWNPKLCTMVCDDIATMDDETWEYVFEDADVVFHEACSKCTVCRDDPERDLLVNALGSFKVFRHASAVGAKVVHASTGSVYGECDRQTESRQYAPRSFYGVSKLAGEQYLRAFHEYYDLDWVALRYFHVYGPRQDNSDKGGVIPIFITKLLTGDPITIFGDGEQTRSFTYVGDVVRANFMAANSPDMSGLHLNVASGIQVSLNTLVDALKTCTGKTCPVVYDDERQGDIKWFNVDNSRLMGFGFDGWTSFRDGIEKTIGWYRNEKA